MRYGTKSAAAAAAKTVVPFSIKANDDEAKSVTGLAAAWSLDSGDDIIRPGAFARTLDHWRASKKSRPIHLIDQHNYGSVNHVLGKMTEAAEVADGLEATFEFIPDDPAADAAYRRVKGGYITGMSIGYMPVAWEYQQKEGGQEWERVRVLKEVKLLEVSLVIWPMNDDARVGAVKQWDALMAALKSGTLTDDQRTQLRALLDAPPVDAGDDAPPPADAQKGLAPDDPKRLEMEAAARDLILRSLGTA